MAREQEFKGDRRQRLKDESKRHKKQSPAAFHIIERLWQERAEGKRK